jgi:hypothetical protein
MEELWHQREKRSFQEWMSKRMCMMVLKEEHERPVAAQISSAHFPQILVEH